MPMSEAEARIRRLMASISIAEHDVVKLREGRGKISQDLAVIGSGFGRTCITKISGMVIGCLSTPTALPGAQIQITGHTSGFSYGTYTLAPGTFTDLELSLISTDTSLDFVVTGPGARYVASGTQTRSVTHCTTNSLANLTASVGSGFNCVTALCNFPPSRTLSLTDSRFGANTVATPGLSTDWIQNVGTPNYTFSGFGVTSGRLVTSSTGSGPTNASWGQPTTVTSCPNGSGAKFDATWTVNAGNANAIAQGYAVGATIRIYEP